MAVFCDLEDDVCSPHSRLRVDAGPAYHQDQLRMAIEKGSGTPSGSGMVQNIRIESLTTNKLAAALTCYPIALSLASHLDLNDLHALAASCRGVHASLTQYAYHLKSESLRCIHDGRPALAEALSAQEEIPHIDGAPGAATLLQGFAVSQIQASAEAVAAGWSHTHLSGLYASAGVSSKISSCARDLVAPCRKCGTAVCRNCAVKPPSNTRIKERLRRLCKTCLDAPVETHFQSLNIAADALVFLPASSASSIRSDQSLSGSSASDSTSRLEHYEPKAAHAFTSSAFLRGPCTCEARGVFLCTPCGGNLRGEDTTYQRVFTWRSRYSTHIGGGLGTGLGLGNQGQKCGRGESCLDTSSEAVCWVEIDCTEDRTHDDPDHDGYSLSRVGTPDLSNNKPGYLQQEVEGIGGVLKKKLKRKVKTGAYTHEYADERESGKCLERERTGVIRSWCGWCARVVPSSKDGGELSVKHLMVG